MFVGRIELIGKTLKFLQPSKRVEESAPPPEEPIVATLVYAGVAFGSVKLDLQGDDARWQTECYLDPHVASALASIGSVAIHTNRGHVGVVKISVHPSKSGVSRLAGVWSSMAVV